MSEVKDPWREKFTPQILDEYMLFVKHCFIEWRCEDSQSTECKIYMRLRLPSTNLSSLIIFNKTTAKRNKRELSSHIKTIYQQYSHSVHLFIVSSLQLYWYLQRLTSSLEFWILDFLPFHLLKDMILIVTPFSYISKFPVY